MPIILRCVKYVHRAYSGLFASGRCFGRDLEKESDLAINVVEARAVNPYVQVVEKVANLLSLLKCSAHMRFPIYQQSFWMRRPGKMGMEQFIEALQQSIHRKPWLPGRKSYYTTICSE